MCYPVTCPDCGKTTWGGCGAHIDGVMKAVPESQQCTCKGNAAPPATPGFFDRLFGR